jgi:chromosome partitioning protein
MKKNSKTITLATDSNRFLPPMPLTSINDLVQMAINAEAVLNQVRESLLSPHLKKVPEFSAFQVAGICGIDRTKLKNAEIAIKSTRGHIKPGQTQRSYSLEETIELVKVLGIYPTRPVDKEAKVIAIASYKKDSGKTTTAVSLAQGLTLKGFKVLLIDLDGRGSATALCGYNPEIQINRKETIMEFFFGGQPDLKYAVKQTYWYNLDLIPASFALFGAEFVIPANDKKNMAEIQKAKDKKLSPPPVYDPGKQLNLGILPLRKLYDVIVIDTGPSLGYLTQNAIEAADAILSPCPQEALDYASLCQFWGIFAELANLLPRFTETKAYDFVEIFINKAKPSNDAVASAITQWIKASFGSHLCAFSLPESVIVQKSLQDNLTIYDLVGTKEVSTPAYKRFKDPMDEFVTHVCNQLSIAWRRA